LLSTAAAAALSGCAIVGSHAPDAGTPPSGMLYHLPKSVLPVELVEKGGALELRVLPARQIVDPKQRYLLKHPVNVFASDNVKVEFDNSGLLLSKLTIDSTDQTLATLKEVARATAIGRAEAASAVGETVLAAGDFDPDQAANEGSNSRLMAALHGALQRHMTSVETMCKSTDLKADDKPAPENCALARTLIASTSRGGLPLLQINAKPLEGERVSTGTVASSKPADCSTGLCYRGQQPFEVTLEVKDLFSRTTVVMLPNQSPAVALPLDRAPFVKTEHTVEFQANGTLKSVETKRPSSALQLVSWPLDVYKAVIGATTELITLRIGAKDKDVELAQKELETSKELKRLADEMAAFKNAPPNTKESAGAGTGSSALLSIPMGRARVDNRTGLLPSPSSCKPGDACPGSAAGLGTKAGQ